MGIGHRDRRNQYVTNQSLPSYQSTVVIFPLPSPAALSLFLEICQNQDCHDEIGTWLKYCFWFFKTNCGWHQTFFVATNTPVLEFWWCLTYYTFLRKGEGGYILKSHHLSYVAESITVIFLRWMEAVIIEQDRNYWKKMYCSLHRIKNTCSWNTWKW